MWYTYTIYILVYNTHSRHTQRFQRSQHNISTLSIQKMTRLNLRGSLLLLAVLIFGVDSYWPIRFRLPLPAGLSSSLRMDQSSTTNPNDTNAMRAINSFVPSVKLSSIEPLSLIQQVQTQLPVPSPALKTGINPVFASANEYIQNFFTNTNSSSEVLKELIQLKNRVDKLEKRAITTQPLPKPKSNVEKFVDSVLSADLLEMNPRTVEICAMIGCFTLGSIISASLLDRLWLLGGIFSAYWASGAVYKDTKGGEIARRIGVQLAALIRDIQEKYNGAIIFYQTGKLAMETSKWWEQYDTRFQITKRMDVIKKSTMERAIYFNSAVTNKWSMNAFSAQISDSWKFIMAAPVTVRSIDGQFRISSSLVKLGRGLYSAVDETLQTLIERGSYDSLRRRKRRLSGNQRGSERSFFSFLWEPRIRYNPRGNLINPWQGPFDTFLFKNNKKNGVRR